ncbi:DUF1592 domain-containing protein [Oceaniferula spumae]|uniref:DUF1592 domain-containing protein n=1 Tax=Oceaniferula spumae TaxID=2979115 RepID=UPI003F4E8FCD
MAKSTTWLSIATIALGVTAGWMILPFLTDRPEVAEKVVVQPKPNETELMAQWEKDIKPMLEHYCYDCHGDGMSKGKLDLDEYPNLASMRKDPKVWEHIIARVDYHLMPPPEEEQPEKKEREKLTAWINNAVFPADQTDPGHVVMRRMNRIEYQNTIDDLLGIDTDLISLLPPDDSGYGFDNNGSALSISPAHIEKYLQAAEKALDKAIVVGPMKPYRIPITNRHISGDGRKSDSGIYLFTRGTAAVAPKIEKAGKYRLVITASASQAGHEPAFLDVHYRKKHIAHFEVKNSLGDEKVFTTEFELKSGKHDIGLTFPNDFYDPNSKNPQRRDRNLMIHQIRLEGPLGVKRQKPSSHRRIFIHRKGDQDNRSYAKAVLTRFANRAFRRPVSGEEIDRYLVLVDKIGRADKSLESGIKSAISAMLVSPSFLFIAPDTAISKHSGKTSAISEHALASRLSYFLWSTMPDDELLALADTGTLRKNLDSQITRMLEDNRSREMVNHFAGQWLQLRDLDAITPDQEHFRKFNRALADDMRTETETLANYILRGNRSLLDFLDADYSFINERLADLYEIPDVKGQNFRRVQIKGTQRRGILTHASILTITSQPNRTSPVLRGKFVLENILDITPPPPPPNLPSLEEAHGEGNNTTVREQLEMHRKKAECAGCHNLMDPVGLAFENYNGIGRWREFDNGRTIDASGKLVTGEALENAESLRLVLLNGKRDEFLRCITIKMMTYALGRGVGRQDRLHIDKVLSELQKKDYTAHTLIKSIIHSVPFQRQRQ